MMPLRSSQIRFALLPAALVLLDLCARTAAAAPPTTLYGVDPLIESQASITGFGTAAHIDPNLINPWGVSESGASPFWVSDNGTGLTTLYTSDGSSVAGLPKVKIPTPSGVGTSRPTGQVFAGGLGFTGSTFIFATQGGTIDSWTGSDGTTAVTAVNNSASGAVYDGLAEGSSGGSNFLYAANFNSGGVDVFNTSFAAAALAGNFTDPNLPTGYAPFNVQNIGGQLYVTYAKQNGAKNADVAGAGAGLVDVFNTDGTFVKRFASGSAAGGAIADLNAPWAVALAPSTGFGQFSGDLLVGNFGNGEITAFDPTTDAFVGALTGVGGQTLKVRGLWDLIVGNGGAGGLANTVYFTAGPQAQTAGVFGSISTVAVPEGNAAILMTPIVLACGVFIVLRRRRLK